MKTIQVGVQLLYSVLNVSTFPELFSSPTGIVKCKTFGPRHLQFTKYS